MKTAVCGLALLLGGLITWEVSLPAAAATTTLTAAEANSAAHPQRRRRRRRRRRRGQRQPTRERIREIQQALIREGYLEGKPSGRWDSPSRAAMMRLQQEHGFPISGELDARSLIKLGLGSETAGVSAPRPLRAEVSPAEQQAENERER